MVSNGRQEKVVFVRLARGATQDVGRTYQISCGLRPLLRCRLPVFQPGSGNFLLGRRFWAMGHLRWSGTAAKIRKKSYFYDLAGAQLKVWPLVGCSLWMMRTSAIVRKTAGKNKKNCRTHQIFVRVRPLLGGRAVLHAWFPFRGSGSLLAGRRF